MTILLYTGETDDRMAEAIEASSHVVVCVSRGDNSYFANCICLLLISCMNRLQRKCELSHGSQIHQSDVQEEETGRYLCDDAVRLHHGQ